MCLAVLGGNTINAGITRDMADQHLFIVHEVLPQSWVGPIVDERVRRQNGLLRMICQVASFFDFGVPVVEGSGLRN